MKMMIYGRNPSCSLVLIQAIKLVLPKVIRKGLCVRKEGGNWLEGGKRDLLKESCVAQRLLFNYLIEFSYIFQ